ncbi:MAG: OmpA family protein [Gemmatimonadota bacterium]
MALFDKLLDMVSKQVGIDADQARRLLDGVMDLLSGDQKGGLQGLLDRLKDMGLGNVVDSWLGRGANQPLKPADVDRALGGSTVDGLARQAGIERSKASSALGLMLPEIVDRLTPDGIIPDMSELGDRVRGWAGGLAGTAAGAATAGSTRARETVGSGSGLGRFLPLLLLLVAAGLVWWFISGRSPEGGEADRIATADETAGAMEETVPSVPTRDASLGISYTDAGVEVSGSLPDEATRTSLLDALEARFGDSARADIEVDPSVGSPGWLDNLGAVLASLKPGTELRFDGDVLSVGGSLPEADLQALTANLKSTLGTDVTVGSFGETAGTLAASANERAVQALRGLGDGVTANELIEALNLSVINFASGSAEIPAESETLLDAAAAALANVPADAVIEVGGHTDTTGDASANERLSQTRADAVRDALINRGVAADDLVARGYGGTRPVASNDTESGRYQNRRIEYAVVQ